ncbi:MAG: hypothetical protein NTZ27_05195 [Ignavibacteriales bacterium]|nr:hypothetical protein [Ignavibacteriales bacterium]
MPFKKHLSGYFSPSGVSRLTYSVSGCFIIKNEKGEVIYLDCSDDVSKTIKEMFNSNHYVWRYKPDKYEIEDCVFKDINYRLKQLQGEIKTLMQSDFEYFD